MVQMIVHSIKHGNIHEIMSRCIILNRPVSPDHEILVLASYFKNLFLEELNIYLDKYPKVSYGTTTIQSDVNTLTSQFWYWYTNWTDRSLKILHRIHIIRKDLALQVNYDENLIRTE